MTRKLSLTTAVAVAALSVGAPAAFAEGKLAGSPEIVLAQPDPMIEDGFAQAVALAGSPEIVLAQPDPMIEDGFAQAVATKRALEVGNYRDAHERGSATDSRPSSVAGYRDANERGSFANRSESQSAVSNYRDAFERAVPPATASVPASVTSSGNDIEWPQVGVGLGIGLLLALGLGLIMRAVHTRPFAH
jgi:hypothetical protein